VNEFTERGIILKIKKLFNVFKKYFGNARKSPKYMYGQVWAP